jgi:hypothetical protein
MQIIRIKCKTFLHLIGEPQGNRARSLYDLNANDTCVITTMDGLIVKVSRASDVLVGAAMLAVKAGNQIHRIPFHTIARITERGDRLV